MLYMHLDDVIHLAWTEMPARKHGIVALPELCSFGVQTERRMNTIPNIFVMRALIVLLKFA